MRFTLRAAVLASCFVFTVTFFGRGSHAAETSPARRLVDQALQAELSGSSGEARAALLQQAIALDPSFSPARWQLGYVQVGDQWLKPQDVPQQAADDKTLVAYRERRDALVDTAANHRELARWCHKNLLPSEARLHWTKVLEFEPTDREAIDALGLKWHEGRLMTRANRR